MKEIFLLWRRVAALCWLLLVSIAVSSDNQDIQELPPEQATKIMTAALEGSPSALLADIMEAHRQPEWQVVGSITVEKSATHAGQGDVSVTIRHTQGPQHGSTMHIEGSRVTLQDGSKIDAVACTTGKSFTPLPAPPTQPVPLPVPEPEPKRLLTKEHFTYRYRNEETGLLEEAVDPAYEDYINRRSPLRTSYDGERVTWSVPCGENGRCGVRAGFSSRPSWPRRQPLTYGQWLAQAALEAEEKERCRLKKERKKREAAEKKQRKKAEQVRKKEEKKARDAARKTQRRRKAEEEKRRKEEAEIARRLNKREPTSGQQFIDSIRSWGWSKERRAQKFAYKNHHDGPPDNPPGGLGEPLALGYGEVPEEDELTFEEGFLDELADSEDDFVDGEDGDGDEQTESDDGPLKHPHPTFDDLDYLHKLAQRYHDHAAAMRAQQDSYDAYADRLAARAAKLDDFVLYEPDQREIKFNEPLPAHVYEVFEDIEDFERFQGNGARYRLHGELRENILLAAETARLHSDNEIVQSQLPVVIAFSQLAREQPNLEAAFSLSDTAFHLANAAKQLGRNLIDSGTVVGYLAGACLSGAVKAVEGSVRGFKEFASAPVESSVRSAIALGKLAYAGMATAHKIIAGSSQERRQLWEQACAAGVFIRDNPDELAAFIFSFYLPHPPTVLSAPAYARKIKNLSTALKRQDNAFYELSQRIAEQFRSFRQPHADPVTPEGIIVHELAKTTKPVSTMMKKAAKHDGKSAGKNGRNSDTGKRGEQIKENGISSVVKAVGPHGHCHSSGKHHINSMGNISPAAKNGQKALDRSVKNPTTGNGTSRIGASEGEIVKLMFTGFGIIEGKQVPTYHAFVLNWDKMSEKLRHELGKLGWVSKSGKVLIND